MGHPHSEGLRLPLLSVNFCVLEPVSCAIGPMGDGACGADGGAQGWCVDGVGRVCRGGLGAFWIEWGDFSLVSWR